MGLTVASTWAAMSISLLLTPFIIGTHSCRLSHDNACSELSKCLSILPENSERFRK